jgi:asparagine synthetase B (glutamine-hydrolysing)
MASLEECRAAIARASDRIMEVEEADRRRHIEERSISVTVPDLATVFDMRLTLNGLENITLRGTDTPAERAQIRITVSSDDLVELAAKIPPDEHLKLNGKGVLKEAARLVVPHEVIDRKKGYFPVPQLKYVDGPYLEMVRDALGSQAARERNIFRQDYLDTLFDDPAGHITPLQGSELWQVGLLEMWLQTHRI